MTDPGVRDPSAFDPGRPPGRELDCSIADGFVLGAVGDCILSRPLSGLAAREEAFAAVLERLAACSVVFGNLETVLVDPYADGAAPHSAWRDWPLACDPAVAADLVRMGFGLLGRANNHALDWGVEGMRASSRRLDEAGLVHAGCGEELGHASRARHRETPHGRVALVSCTTTFRETTDALPSHGAAPGRPGLNGLELTRVTAVPDAVLARVEALREELARLDVAQALGAFAPGEPGYGYTPDPEQLAGILRQVRQGKAYADLLVFALHAHEAHGDRHPQAPATVVGEIARAAVDAGADVVVVTGIHHLGPVEVYRGRPILHGLGNFFWSDVQEPLSADLYRWSRKAAGRAFERPEAATDADLTLLLNYPDFAHVETFDSVLAELEFEAGRCREIRLRPVDLGRGRRLTESGIPRAAGPEATERILGRLAEISAPYGTAVETLDGCARVRVA